MEDFKTICNCGNLPVSAHFFENQRIFQMSYKSNIVQTTFHVPNEYLMPSKKKKKKKKNAECTFMKHSLYTFSLLFLKILTRIHRCVNNITHDIKVQMGVSSWCYG